jgi:predicted  nucleic acid-binding Zn-ribbon protein
MIPTSIPIPLMETLNRINDNLSEIKERLARLEGTDYKDSIRSLRDDIEKERDKRISIQLELTNIKTKLAPVIVFISMVGGVILEVAIRTIHL